MASATYYTYLMKGTTVETTTTWTKLVDIMNRPALGGSPSQIEITTLSDYPRRVYIPGLEDGDGAMDFNALYTPTDYDTLKALEDTELDLSIWLGASTAGSTATPDGNLGKFTFKGKIRVFLDAGEVNAANIMVVSVTPTTQITKESA